MKNADGSVEKGSGFARIISQLKEKMSVRNKGLSQDQRMFWENNGYLILPSHFSDDEVESVNAYVEGLWAKSTIPNPMITIDAFIGLPNEHRIQIDRVDPAARSQPYKLNDLFMVSSSVRSLILEDRLVAILKQILKDEPLVCNTLNLEYGSQQDFHTDTLYMPAPSGVTGSPFYANMVASWIALEDCTFDAGPLIYYPGSHKIPGFRFSDGKLTVKHSEFENYKNYMADQVAKRKLKTSTFEAKKGDLLIWHETLFHGGSPIVNPSKTRRSLVTHYFRASDVPADYREACNQGFIMKREPHKVPS